MVQARSPAAPAPGSKKNKELAPDTPWKSRIAHAYGKDYVSAISKDSIIYTTVQVEGGFTCTLTCDKFPEEYESEKVFASKKVAEESAAMVALLAQFPAWYKTVPLVMKKKRALGGFGSQAAEQEAIARRETGGVKRKFQDPSVQKAHPTDAKSRLNYGAMILAERPITKEDLEYTVAEVNGKSVATVTLHFLDGNNSFKGKPALGVSKDSKKVAEQNAAEVAYKAYKDEIADKVPEHEARKEAKQAAFQAKIDARKAEEEAANAA